MRSSLPATQLPTAEAAKAARILHFLLGQSSREGRGAGVLSSPPQPQHLARRLAQVVNKYLGIKISNCLRGFLHKGREPAKNGASNTWREQPACWIEPCLDLPTT